jgi:hypothetical protein
MAEITETIEQLKADVKNIQATFKKLSEIRGLTLDQRKYYKKAKDVFDWWQHTNLAEFIKSFEVEGSETPNIEH